MTMNNEIAMNLFYYVLLCLFMLSQYGINVAWNSYVTHMHHTTDNLYFKKYNLVIKHGLLLVLEL